MSDMTSQGNPPHPCPLCGAGSDRLFAKAGYWIRGCATCGHQFAELAASPNHVASIYDDSYFFGGGAGYADYLSEADLLRDRGRRYARLLRRYRSPGTVLDVGAAAGFVLQGFVDAGWTGAGVEPNAGMAEYARTRLGLPMATGTIEEFAAPTPFDLVCLIQVVGHFVEPGIALAAAARATRPGGLWLFETWNRESWTARALGRQWHEYSPPSVLHWFSPSGLDRLAARNGFRRVGQGRPLKLIRGAHAKSLLLYKLGASRLGRLAGLALKMVPGRLTLPYPAEDLFWALFRKV